MTTTPPTPAPDPRRAGASAWVTVDLDAIRDNVAELVRRAGSAAGHGGRQGRRLRPRPRPLGAGGARRAGRPGSAWPSSPRPSSCVRRASPRPCSPGSSCPVPTSRGAIDADIEVTVGSGWTLDAVVAAARERGRPARVQVKVDTGLGRGGILTDWSEMVQRVAAAEAEGAVEVTGVWSHLAWADAPQHPTVRAQQERFVEACDELERAGVRPPLRHLANSAATLTNPSAHFDIVRPGLAVYGLSPVPDLGDPAALRPARGDAGHGAARPSSSAPGRGRASATATSTSPTATPCSASCRWGTPTASHGRREGGGRCWSAAERLPVAGRVCMDQLVVDLGPGYAGAAGDEVVVLGRGGRRGAVGAGLGRGRRDDQLRDRHPDGPRACPGCCVGGPRLMALGRTRRRRQRRGRAGAAGPRRLPLGRRPRRLGAHADRVARRDGRGRRRPARRDRRP